MVTAAGRLAAAFEFVKRPDEAEHIQKAFAKLKITLKLVNPFELADPTITPSKERSPLGINLKVFAPNAFPLVLFPTLSQTS